MPFAVRVGRVLSKLPHPGSLNGKPDPAGGARSFTRSVAGSHSVRGVNLWTSLAFQSVAPGDYVEFDPDCVFTDQDR